jgi:outer membrane protein OmpA-like peptidoglycan-associated protein
MNRYLIPILILLWAFLYSWFWNCVRKPECQDHISITTATIPPPVLAEEPDPVLTEEEKLLFEPMDIYFEAAKSGINRNPELDNFLATAQKYLAANPDKKLSLTGHSDSDGSDETNLRLSLSRAETVKKLLIAEGFPADQLITSGAGESQPKASNDTPEGKAQNRRVAIRLAQ